jgi:hypothetical protein
MFSAMASLMKLLDLNNNELEMFLFPDGNYQVDFETKSKQVVHFIADNKTFLFSCEFECGISLEDFENLYCFVDSFNKNSE